MHDIAGVSIINVTVLITSYVRHRAVRRFRTELLDDIHSLRSAILAGLDSLHATVTDKLNGIHQDQHMFRLLNREQNQK